MCHLLSHRRVMVSWQNTGHLGEWLLTTPRDPPGEGQCFLVAACPLQLLAPCPSPWNKFLNYLALIFSHFSTEDELVNKQKIHTARTCMLHTWEQKNQRPEKYFPKAHRDSKSHWPKVSFPWLTRVEEERNKGQVGQTLLGWPKSWWYW